MKKWDDYHLNKKLLVDYLEINIIFGLIHDEDIHQMSYKLQGNSEEKTVNLFNTNGDKVYYVVVEDLSEVIYFAYTDDGDVVYTTPIN